MRRRPPTTTAVLLGCLLALLGGNALVEAPAPAAAEAPPERVLSEEGWKEVLQSLSRGMLLRDVQTKLRRPPRRIARQLIAHRYLEQWYYDLPFPTRLDFAFDQGEQPYLLAAPQDGR
jgi:hypothetical protein